MGVPEITLTEDKRCLLSKVSSGICLATIPFNFIMLAMGIYIELAVQDKIGLIEGSRDALPAFMIVLSFFGLIGNVLGARVCWVIQDIKRRKASLEKISQNICNYFVGNVCVCICFFHALFRKHCFTAQIIWKRNIIFHEKVFNRHAKKAYH